MLSPELLRHVVEAATLAPSVHNTQPWRFVAGPDRLDLYADLARRLEVLDPDGRQLHLSCGAALLHARVAARALGVDVRVELLPEAADPTHLASLHLTEGPPAAEDEVALATAILSRHTHRGVFDGRPLPGALIDRLRSDVEAEGAVLRPVTTEEDTIALEVLLSRADEAERTDEAYQRELAAWVRRDDDAVDGVPLAAVAVVPGSTVRQRSFTDEAQPLASAPTVERPDLLVLATDEDDARAWLVAGQALGRLLLRAADHGVLAQPLGQVTDLVGCRLGLRGALGMVGVPQLVLRMGFAASTPAAPRRAVADVLAVTG